MPELLRSITASLVGDDRHYSLEHRLFNTLSLLNAVTNLGGALATLNLANYKFLLPLQLSTGVLFLACYYLSRFRHAFRLLYWPFVLLTAGFVLLNALQNAGTLGGAHYYLIPALVIAVVLSDGFRTTLLAIGLFAAAAAALLLVEQLRPGWIRPYDTPRERALDVSANLVFAQVFTGLLVLVLTQNLN